MGRRCAVVLIYFFVKNVFGGGSKAPPAGLAFQPLVNRSDPVSLRVFITERDSLAPADLDAGPAWQAPRFTLPLPTEHSGVVTYRPSEVRCRTSLQIPYEIVAIGFSECTVIRTV